MHTVRLRILAATVAMTMGCGMGDLDALTPDVPEGGAGSPLPGTPDGGDAATPPGSTSSSGGSSSGGEAGTTVTQPPNFKGKGQVFCTPIGSGTAAVIVNGIPRLFDVQLPANTSNMALLFQWHGWNQLPNDFKNTIVYDPPAGKWRAFDPNAFPMPLMIVTPYSMKLLPPIGLDWDIVDGSADTPFFEGMLECIQAQYKIDKTRIYSFGFSAGSVFTNLLSAKYPKIFAATISESGVWFGDPVQQKTITVPIMPWNWPALNPADGGNVLLTHGGPNDQVRPIVDLEKANIAAIPYLKTGGRTVTECTHNFGHTLAPDLTQAMIYQYMWAHQLGAPPIANLPASFPTPAKPLFSTACTLHKK